MRKRTKDNFYRICAGLAFVILAGIAGSMDYEDAVMEERAYCKNVHEGIWPDYDEIYAEVCYEGQRRADLAADER